MNDYPKPGSMSLQDLKVFMENCRDKGVTIPNSAIFVVSDFEAQVPEAYVDNSFVEYNDRLTQTRAHICKINKG